MAHGIIVTVPAPIDMYHAVNDQVGEEIGPSGPTGLLVHIARKLPEGFQVIEVWESKQQCDEFGDQVLGPIIDRVSGGQARPRGQITDEFDVENVFVGPGVAAAPSE